ncbi:l-psp endoribonuclease family [Fusarium albosuccineum]|uniref:L-psp endoribonuclease family n=1 Tax=Fusarium albosuccineum TaxID=1237068 RepID=A0A8H4LN27_9HYPO|nr:l-psp endoribonuclease family [Fusarium albosuccineum]
MVLVERPGIPGPEYGAVCGPDLLSDVSNWNRFLSNLLKDGSEQAVGDGVLSDKVRVQAKSKTGRVHTERSIPVFTNCTQNYLDTPLDGATIPLFPRWASFMPDVAASEFVDVRVGTPLPPGAVQEAREVLLQGWWMMFSISSANGYGYILPSEAPQSLANYVHARVIGNQIFVSGTSPHAADGTYAGCKTDENWRHTGVTNGKVGMESVVDVTVFLTDMKDYKGMNEEWDKVWPTKEKTPAHTCVQVAALPIERLNVEMKLTALLPAELVGTF